MRHPGFHIASYQHPMEKLTAEQLEDIPMCTALRLSSGHRVSMVEHLLAALAGMGIFNAAIHVLGAELPILDGSASPWVEKIKQAGIVELADPQKALRLPLLWNCRMATALIAAHQARFRDCRSAPASRLHTAVLGLIRPHISAGQPTDFSATTGSSTYLWLPQGLGAAEATKQSPWGITREHCCVHSHWSSSRPRAAI